MRGIGLVLSVAAGGCGFTLTNSGNVGDDQIDALVDAAVGGDDARPPDAPSTQPIDAPPQPAERKWYAASDTMLYQIDVDARTATPVGVIQTSSPVQTFDVDGLAFDGTNLLGLSSGSTELLVIDPATAAVTARRTISPAGSYGGLTVAPAGEAGPSAVVFAGSGSKLVKIDPATGAATTIGTFGYWGGTLQFFSDLAWVSGDGLYATLQGGYCNTRCFARVNATTGSAVAFRSDLTGSLYGLSGYRGSLWTLHHDGPVLRVDRTNGAMTTAFDPGVAWTEAAQ